MASEIRKSARASWKVDVMESGLDENNIKGAFYPRAPLAPLYLTTEPLH